MATNDQVILDEVLKQSHDVLIGTAVPVVLEIYDRLGRTDAVAKKEAFRRELESRIPQLLMRQRS